uniref:P0 protein n=1 Tax=Cynanchum yellow mottle-associated virus TaxID=2926297 RepID=A0AA48K6G6_9VIRU|nr:P0 protein [Cynanchum yellow mottle-associated virus]
MLTVTPSGKVVPNFTGPALRIELFYSINQLILLFTAGLTEFDINNEEYGVYHSNFDFSCYYLFPILLLRGVYGLGEGYILLPRKCYVAILQWGLLLGQFPHVSDYQDGTQPVILLDFTVSRSRSNYRVQLQRYSGTLTAQVLSANTEYISRGLAAFKGILSVLLQRAEEFCGEYHTLPTPVSVKSMVDLLMWDGFRIIWDSDYRILARYGSRLMSRYHHSVSTWLQMDLFRGLMALDSSPVEDIFNDSELQKILAS